MIDVMTPRETVNDESVIVTRVLVSSGNYVKKGQVIVEVETSKTSIEVASPEDGLVVHELKVGQEIDVSSQLFSINPVKDAVSPEHITLPGAQDISDSKLINTTAVLSKAALARAKNLNVDITKFSESWVSKADVERAAGLSARSTGTHFGRFPASPPPKPDNSAIVTPYREETLSKRKRAEVESLIKGDHSSTTSTIGITINLPGERLVSPPFIFKNSIADLIVFEGARLFSIYPELNGFYLGSKSWAKFEEVNFGISFDTGRNLKVLAIRNADKHGLTEIQKQFQELLDLYESGAAIPSGILTSSTVTLSDLSNEDASFMLPLINGRQSLILGVVRGAKNQFSIYASFDHRLADGLSVSKFLRELRDRLLSFYRDLDGYANIFCYSCGRTVKEDLSLGNRGFLKIVLPNGNDENLCRNCFDGW